MRRYLSLFARYFVQYAKVRLSYRGDFLLSVLATVASTACGMAVVFLIFRHVPRIAGWSFTQILFLYGFSLLPLSLFNTISVNLFYFSDSYIVMGKFDQVLLRPVHPLFQVLSEKFRLEALGDTVLGTTPLDQKLPRSDAELTFTFKLAGHKPEKRSVTATADAEVKATLVRLGGAASKPPPHDDLGIKTGR